MLIATGLLVLSVIGLLISFYFTLVTYRLMSADQRFIPAFCRMTDRSCASIVDSRQARLFGVPNSLLGIAYYLGVILWVAFSLRSVPRLTGGLIVVSLGTVLSGLYLLYSLLVVLKVRCILCLASHILNAMILLLLVADAVS